MRSSTVKTTIKSSKGDKQLIILRICCLGRNGAHNANEFVETTLKLATEQLGSTQLVTVDIKWKSITKRNL